VFGGFGDIELVGVDRHGSSGVVGVRDTGLA
jgi:hypothetical protein